MSHFSLFPEEPQPLPRLVRVAVLAQVEGCYDYGVPPAMPLPPLGAIVQVPFAGRVLYGMVWEHPATSDVSAHKLKMLRDYCAHLPPYPAALRAFLEKVAAYNCIPLGQVLKLAMPLSPALLQQKTERWVRLCAPLSSDARTPKQHRLIALLQNAPLPQAHLKEQGFDTAFLKKMQQQGVITAYDVPLIYDSPNIVSHPKPLTKEQSVAVAQLHELQGFSPLLLEGATGAGKTEVFFAYAETLMQAGKQVLILVPEIALSLQLVERATARFGFAPILWHSSQTPARRSDALQQIMAGSVRLIIGARSALFLPYAALGALIVDEEHEVAYKQEEGAIYHGRDMAVLRAHCEAIPVILTSATPSLESLANKQSGKYQHLTLARRDTQAALPTVQLIDMRREKMPALRWISPTLQGRIDAHLQARQQSLLFLNRKGYAPLVLCRACGHRYECPSCTAWLVYHAHKKHLDCHHCGLTIPLPAHCPSCHAEADKLAMCGPGIERLAEEVRTLFPHSRLLVFSGEQSHSPTALQHALQQVALGEVDIVIGTQILAKGHHFPYLRLVGVIDADAGLHGGDIRGSERTYQLLHQLAGRAGREAEQGEVWLQSYNPTHPLMQALQAWDREGFIGVEMSNRALSAMPPYGKLASLIIEGKNEAEVQKVAHALARTAPQLPHLRVIGPANAPLYKLRNDYRVRFLITAPRNAALQSTLKAWRASVPLPREVHCKIDIDPMSFM